MPAPNEAKPWVARAAAAGLIAALVCFGVVYFNSEYIVLLLGVFLLFLSIGHLLLVGGELSTPAVRWMDFGYVVAGCAAALLAASSSNRERDSYLDIMAQWKLNVRSYFLPVSPEPSKVADYIDRDAKFYCKPSDRMYSKSFCDWTADVAAQLRRMSPTDDLQAFAHENAKKASRNAWDATIMCEPPRKPGDANSAPVPEPPDAAEDRMFLCGQAVFTSDLLSALDIMAKQQALDAPRQNTSPPKLTAWGLIRTVLWPLILAAAFALRVTKATADVTGWAR